MTKGDHVKLTAESIRGASRNGIVSIKKGREGKILAIDERSEYPYYIEFGNKIRTWCAANELEKLNES